MRWLAAVCVVARTAGIAMPAARPVTARPTADAALQALEWRLLKRVRECVRDYGMIGAGETVAVAASGGKDSNALIYLLREMSSRRLLGRDSFDLRAVHLDQKQPGHVPKPLADWVRGLGIPFDLVEEDTYSIVVEKTAPTKSYCGLCSRLRRGILYTHTQQIGAHRLALGHHRDDALETLLLNMVHQGTMKAMPARYVASRGVDVIRPLMYCAEDDLREYATRLEFPILPCNLCGSQPAGKPSQRQGAKQLLHFLDAFGGDGEDVRENMLRALSDVRPSHLLDRDLRGACGLDPCTGEPVDDRASRVFRAPGGDDDDELGIRR
jgi:tRNA 2-thiocytidine biosynthesis protein TtcA